MHTKPLRIWVITVIALSVSASTSFLSCANRWLLSLSGCHRLRCSLKVSRGEPGQPDAPVTKKLRMFSSSKVSGKCPEAVGHGISCRTDKDRASSELMELKRSQALSYSSHRLFFRIFSVLAEASRLAFDSESRLAFASDSRLLCSSWPRAFL